MSQQDFPRTYMGGYNRGGDGMMMVLIMGMMMVLIDVVMGGNVVGCRE